ncbi:MAG: hypothetical protein R3345_12810 [Fulvivirga sp.]|nr:hypothetical protein [Fulvivirga sp.]
MKFIIKIILIAGLSYLLQLLFPFWVVAIVAFIINIAIQTNGWTSFLSGFIGVGLLWFIVASGIDSRSEGILSDQVAELFYVNSFLLKIITGFIGGLVAGFGGLCARMLFKRKSKTPRGPKYYS